MNRTYPNRLSESKIYGEVYGLLLNEIQICYKYTDRQ